MQRNFILFILVSAAILAGWYFIAAPTPPKKDDVDPKKIAQIDDTKKKKDPTEEVKKKDDPKEEVKKKDDPKEEIKKKDDPKEVKKDDPKKKDIVAKEDAEERDRTEILGGDDFHLNVEVTARGAGVRKLTLNRFKAADWRGRPTDRLLELIQDDPFAPSFRMYHYLKPLDENPVLGLGEKNWKFEERKKLDDGTQEVRFSTTVPAMDDVKIVKTYRLAPKDYHVTLLLELERDRKADKTPVDFRFQLTGGQGLPIEGEWYAAIFRNAYIGLVESGGGIFRKLEESSRISPRRGGDAIPDNKNASSSGYRLQYAGAANQYFASMIVVDDKQPKEDGAIDPAKILAWARPTLETNELRGFVVDFDDEFITFRDVSSKVFRYRMLERTKRHLSDLKIEKGQKAVLSFYLTPKDELVATWIRLGDSLRGQFDDITVRVNSEVISLEPGDKAVRQFILYHGPVKAALLAQFTGDKAVPDELVERYTRTLHLRTLTDYHSDNFLGKVSSKIMLTDLIILVTRFMHWVLNLLHYVFGYGLSIVVLTVMVRGAMFPISRKQAIFSIKMQEMAPELKKIQDKYPDDPQAKMQATQEFYRKHGINPLGSCWPVFLQMPIFLGLYFAFQESIHFRLAPFLWIESLSAPDMLIGWGESIPYISTPDHLGSMFYLGPFLNILPLCAVVLMMIQQMQTMPPPTDEQQAMQQKMLKFMSIFFGIMFYKVAAGLCIYFVASSLWGMAERKLLPKKKTVDTPAAQPAASTAIKAGAPKGKWAKPVKKEKADETALDRIKAWWLEVLKSAEKK